MRRFVLALWITGCATAPPPEPEPVTIASSALDGWESSRGGPAGTTVWHDPPGPRESVRISPEERARVPGRRINVRFDGARLDSAFRLLAEAADVSIVLGEGLDADVTVELRSVHPMEAMRVLAEAHGVELRRIGETVIARRRE